MDRTEIMGTIEMLAKSQGFYGWLLDTINNTSDEYKEELFTKLENANIKDAVDLVMYIEG